MKIAVLTPSRSRAEGYRLMIKSAIDTAARPELLKFYCAIDLDDPELVKYQELLRSANEYLHIDIIPRQTITNRWIALYWLTDPDIQLFSIVCDDCRFVTQGWDERVREIFSERKGLVVATHDGENYHPYHPFMDRAWIDAAGYIFNPAFEHFYVDPYLELVARHADRYIKESGITIQHLHPRQGGKRDALYTENEKHIKHDRAVWEKIKLTGIDEAKRINKILETA